MFQDFWQRLLVGGNDKRYPIVISVSINPLRKRKFYIPFSNLSGSVETGPKNHKTGINN